MRKFASLLLLLFFFRPIVSWAQCPTTDLVIKSQAELNNLFNSYPNCHKLTKSITFDNPATSTFSNLNLMLKIDTILGDLSLKIKNMPSVQGFSNIKYIGGNLNFNQNDKLLELPSFDSLQQVKKEIKIGGNNSLISIRGFDNLQILGDLTVGSCDNLDTLDAFHKLQTLTGGLSINNLVKIKIIKGFEELQYCGNSIDLDLTWSENLTAIPPFNKVEKVKADFRIVKAKLISFQGLQSLDSLGNSLNLSLPLATSILIAPNARYIYRIAFTNCPLLTRLEGFDLLLSANTISINLPSLTQLCTFPNLEKTTGNLNFVLEGMQAFDVLPKLKEAEEIYFSANSASYFQVAPLLQKVSGPMLLSGFKALSCNHFNQLSEVNGALDLIFSDINSLPQFDSLLYVRSLTIHGTFNNKRIDGFNNLHTIKENLSIDNQSLVDSIVGFQKLRYCGGQMSINGNKKLIYLNEFPLLDTLGGLSLTENNKLTSLNGFNNLKYLYKPQIRGIYIYNSNDLASINGFENLDYCGEINISNQVSLKKISGFTLLREVNGDITFQGKIQELPDFNELEKIGGKLFINTQELIKLPTFIKLHSILGDLWIWALNNISDLGQWPSLRIVKGTISINNSNLISHLSAISKVDPSFVTKLELFRNNKLEICNNPFVCAYLALGKPYDINTNAPGCNNASEIICTGGLVRGEVYYDRNANGTRDMGEPGIPNMKINVNLGNPQLISNELGEMLLYCDIGGQYNFVAVDHPAFTPTTPTSLNYIYDDTDKNKTVFSIGYIHAQISHAGSVYFTSDALRCNDTIIVHIKARNEGSYDENGSITLHFNEVNRFIEFTPTPAEVDVAYGSCTWKFSNLIPPSNFTIDGRFQVPSEQNVGDTLRFDLTYDIKNTDGSLQRLDSTHFEGRVRCAFDPNDLSVSPIDTLRRSDESQIHTLTYTIRFQNLGNDYAEDVNIYDLITTDLDRNSIQFVSSSHPCNILLYGDILRFNFSGINLPAKSQNDSLSQGFVTFVVNTKSGLPNGTVIGNTAEIYFDQNAPILTNTTINTIDDLKVSTLENDLDFISIFPNPVSDQLCTANLSGAASGKVEIFSMDQKKLYEAYGSCHPVSFLAPGMYWAFITVADKKNVRRFVKI